MSEPPAADPGPSEPESPAARVAFLVVAVIVALGVVAAIVFRPRPGPPPEEISGDALLVQGRELYLSRCVSCHGPRGRGDGPIAATVGPTKPGDLTDDRWVHGDRPDQVLGVIARGVPGTSMAAWKGTFSDEELRAVAAYTYHLAGRAVPEELRRDAAGADR